MFFFNPIATSFLISYILVYTNVALGALMCKRCCDLVFLPIITVLVPLVLIAVALRISGLPDDSPLEEAIEEVIEEHTGIQIDLTPNSKETTDATDQEPRRA